MANGDILDSVHIPVTSGKITVVAVEQDTDEWTARIGVGKGFSDNDDAVEIGQRDGVGVLSEQQALGFFPSYSSKTYIS